MVLAEFVKLKHGLDKSCCIEWLEGIMLEPCLLQPCVHYINMLYYHSISIKYSSMVLSLYILFSMVLENPICLGRGGPSAEVAAAFTHSSR